MAYSAPVAPGTDRNRLSLLRMNFSYCQYAPTPSAATESRAGGTKHQLAADDADPLIGQTAAVNFVSAVGSND